MHSNWCTPSQRRGENWGKVLWNVQKAPTSPGSVMQQSVPSSRPIKTLYILMPDDSNRKIIRESEVSLWTRTVCNHCFWRLLETTAIMQVIAMGCPQSTRRWGFSSPRQKGCAYPQCQELSNNLRNLPWKLKIIQGKWSEQGRNSWWRDAK